MISLQKGLLYRVCWANHQRHVALRRLEQDETNSSSQKLCNIPTGSIVMFLEEQTIRDKGQYVTCKLIYREFMGWAAVAVTDVFELMTE